MCVLNHSVMSDSLWPLDCSPLGCFDCGDSPGKNTGVGFLCPPPGGLPNPEIKLRYPELQVDSLLSGSPGKPTNTGVGSLCLLQGLFSTQGSNWGLLHFIRILYQLSYYNIRHVTLTIFRCMVQWHELNIVLWPLLPSISRTFPIFPNWNSVSIKHEFFILPFR